MFEIDPNCPYLSSECYELGCAYCSIDLTDLDIQLVGRSDEDDD